MSTVWLHLRTSPIRWALPAFVVIDLAVLFLRNRHWIGVWPETGAAAQVPAYLLGIVGAGAAAWSAGASQRHGLTEQVRAARVPPMVSEAHRLGATVIVLLIPYLIGQATAFAVTARTFPPGVHLWLGYLLLGLFTILTSVALGWACGQLFGPVFAPLAATLGFLFLTTLLDRDGSVVISGRPEVAVDPLPLALRLGSIVALILVLLWLPAAAASGPVRRRTWLLVPVALPLVVVMLGTDVVADRKPPGTRVTCVQGSATLCIWPEHEKYLPQLRALNARIDLLPDAFVRPSRINEVGLQKTRYIGPDGKEYLGYEEGPPIFYILEGSPWSYAGDIGTSISASTFGYQDEGCDWQRITSSDEPRLWALDAWLEVFLAGGGSPNSHTNAPAQMQQAWAEGRAVAGNPSRAAQFRWAEGEVNELRGRYCPTRR
ncbi:hypothetical protein K7640_20320 [Micromonospora sp. PLK6-60]|uniref:hypothetical protein n=1 Tax=Micromonospora sp. PLK6-60 TaxID=2873383 RepID=UPI001CA75E79|nr:hypothetical protein [Micromonospora sp. PLK6-60]MBY8874177.1 hypothetical protein [Micromonospora sp. PLK6-60]